MNSKKKVNALTVIRAVVQILSFILFPGFFITLFNNIKTIWTSIIGGTASFATLTAPVLVTAAVLVITFILGRFFCGFICSFGAMGDLLSFVGRKLHIPQLRVSAGADRVLKYLKYAVLIYMILGVWTFGIGSDTTNIDPWSVFGLYSSYKGWTDLSGFLSAGGALLLLIVVGSLFVDRFFCRWLCPLGAVFTLVSSHRIFRIKKPREGCGACRACSKRCPMAIGLSSMDEVRSGECIDCMRCVTVCPRRNVTADPKPAVSALIASGALAGMFYAGNITQSLLSGSSVSASAATATGKYIDGTYTGSAQGYRGTVEVSVTVKSGAISDISVLSYKDDSQFFNKAKSTIISEIIAAQDTDVSTVSGATYSSKGIIAAVSDALSTAQNSSAVTTTASQTQAAATTQNETTTKTASTTAAAANSTTTAATAAAATTAAAKSTTAAAAAAAATTAASASGFTDGTYSGSGTGLRGTTSVTVTVSGGKITSINIVSYQDDSQYFSRAKSTIISEIIAAQSINVSTVSGATFSSNGIIEAVADALDISFTNPNSTMSGGGKH